MNAVYFSLVIVLVAAAITQKRDQCAAVIGMGLGASLMVTIVAPASPLPYVAAIDAMTCLAMATLWVAYSSMRAWTIGFIGLAKIGATVAAYVVDAYTIHWIYAIFINAAFVLQVLVSGGWIDAMGNRLDNLFARIAPVRHGLLRDGAR